MVDHVCLHFTRIRARASFPTCWIVMDRISWLALDLVVDSNEVKASLTSLTCVDILSLGRSFENPGSGVARNRLDFEKITTST